MTLLIQALKKKIEKASIWTPWPKERERTRIKKERRRWTRAAGGSRFCFNSFSIAICSQAIIWLPSFWTADPALEKMRLAIWHLRVNPMPCCFRSVFHLIPPAQSPCGLREEKEVLKSMKCDSEGATVSTPMGSAVVDKRASVLKEQFQACMCPSQLEVQ